MENYDPNKILYELTTRGDLYASTKAVYMQLDDLTKTVLAGIKARYEGSDAAKTTKALADEQYRNHLNGLAEARSRFLSADVHYRAYQAYLEALRTEQSNYRAERRGYGA